ncbi:MAG: DNA polymerase I [Alphaproteobacteria bacterium]|nr:DNA polymerase I [Alphaproteobacteria bacterium]
MTKPHLTLIDGSGFIFRAYHAMAHSKRPLTNPQGVPVGAVYVYTNMLIKLLTPSPSGGGPGWGHSRQDNQSPGTDAPLPTSPLRGEEQYIAVIFDAARKTFRNDIYPEYKANRPPAPDDLIPQFPLVRDATRALGLPAIEMEGYEADDIIATYARQACEQGMDVTIISSDKDLMQLVGPCVSMFDAMKDKQIGVAEVVEKFGVPPEKVLDVLSLIGDTSDNVPGVPSIGPKTAAELIGQFGDLDSLLARTSEIKQPKRREVIETHRAQAKLSRDLIRLENHVPLVVPLANLAFKARDHEEFAAFLAAQGFKSLLAKLGKGQEASGKSEPAATTHASSPMPHAYCTISTEAELAAWLADARKVGRLAFDTETTSLDATQAELVGFSLCSEVGRACYVPLGHKVAGDRWQVAGAAPDLFNLTPEPIPLAPDQIPIDRALALLKPVLEDTSILKIGHNIKYDMVVVKNYDTEIMPVDDTMLLSYALSAGLHGQGMDELSELHLGIRPISYDEVTGTGVKRLRFDAVEIDKASAYAAEDADITLRLYEVLKPKVAAEKLVGFYETIERPLIGVIARMEEAGIKVDVKKLTALSADFAQKIAALEREIKQLAGVDFNVASPKQLGEILFERMGLPGGKKSAKTGAYATGAEVLEELAEAGHVIAEKVLAYRGLAKLKNTYCDTLPAQINPKTGRVHTSFAMAVASTGRLSSSDPNLQNIPIRSEEGRKIREAFVADGGNVLLSADYSQIELRLLAHMADIAVLKDAFQNGEDIHAITASSVFGVPLYEMTPELRRRAKAVNFGIIYGISAHGLSVQLGIGRAEAADIINSYFETYPGIRDFMESCKDFARTHGYVETLFKRRCHVPGINDKNGARRQFSERAAINAPLQGTAADIIKKAMIAIDKGIRQETLGIKKESNPRLLLQVHDELIFELPETAVEIWSPRIKEVMEGAASLSVPLTVEVGVGKHWGEVH